MDIALKAIEKAKAMVESDLTGDVKISPRSLPYLKYHRGKWQAPVHSRKGFNDKCPTTPTKKPTFTVGFLMANPLNHINLSSIKSRSWVDIWVATPTISLKYRISSPSIRINALGKFPFHPTAFAIFISSSVIRWPYGRLVSWMRGRCRWITLMLKLPIGLLMPIEARCFIGF